MQVLIVLVVVVLVAYVVSEPLRRRATRSSGPTAETEGAGGPILDEEQARRLADLEAARETKYAEIREAELDHQTGKLSDADFEAVDGSLRAEAVEILRELDRVRDARAATIGER